ncbi:MAG TPA: hypothetical protein VFA20_04975 [Myxococcaceae bacterium]|nr:hypothetical protein [Myxococcaceae bacterium]
MNKGSPMVMDPEQAYRAVVAFLREHWERRPVPGDFGDFYGMCRYVPGKGTRDPAMWYDWLAWAKQVQTGELVPRATGRRGSLTAELIPPLGLEQAYRAMYAFIEEYWNVVSRPAELGELLGEMRYTDGAGTANPEMWQRWLATVQKVQADRLA